MDAIPESSSLPLGERWLQGAVCSLQGQRAVVISSSEL